MLAMKTIQVSKEAMLKRVARFSLTLVHAAPGKGAALHAHPTVEVFMPLSGRWAIDWGDAGEHEIVLEP